MKAIALHLELCGQLIRQAVLQVGSVLDAAQPAFGNRRGIRDAVECVRRRSRSSALRTGRAAVNGGRQPLRLYPFIEAEKFLRLQEADAEEDSHSHSSQIFHTDNCLLD